jgi:hypothetical protein
MTYEELRQRCLNYAGMHPSHPGRLQDMVRSAATQSQVRREDFMVELARFIDEQCVQARDDLTLGRD